MPDRRRWSWADKAAWVIGSGFGSGFAPIAPGTAGSAVAAAAATVLMLAVGDEVVRLATLLGLCVGGFGAGVWATDRMSSRTEPDPGSAVADEFVGMWLSLMPVATLEWGRDSYADLLPAMGWTAVSFAAFRIYDMVKPWPCGRLEGLPGGWGIMLDDVAAGVWALITVSALLAITALLG